MMLKKTHKINGIFLLFLACLILSSCLSEMEKGLQAKPNILLIVADDAGYSDFSCYGGEIPTPNIDALADEGIIMTDFHVAPNCAPTRAAMLSGMDNHLAGGASHWADNAPLIPGKPSPYSVNGKIIDKLPEDFYSSKNYVDSLISYINSETKQEKPFFAYLAFTAPHNPLHAPKEYINKYKGKYDAGWEEIASKRLARLKEFGLVPENQGASNYPTWLAKWDSLSDKQKASRARAMKDIMSTLMQYIDKPLNVRNKLKIAASLKSAKKKMDKETAQILSAEQIKKWNSIKETAKESK